jgi:hypothetical protein
MEPPLWAINKTTKFAMETFWFSTAKMITHSWKSLTQVFSLTTRAHCSSNFPNVGRLSMQTVIVPLWTDYARQ